MIARREPFVLLIVGLAIFVALGIRPSADRLTWVLENFPIAIAVPILIATYRRFPLTPLAYRLIFLHALVLMVGGHYSYANVPLGNWVRDAFGLARNPYDRLGHFAQGFVPALIAREVLLRTTPLRRGGMLAFLVVSVALAISAAYELVEWCAALATGEAATAFLGTQGDPWDTQWDMFLALVAATVSLVLLARLHDRQLARLSERGGRPPAFGV
jgi:putative membrane protein